MLITSAGRTPAVRRAGARPYGSAAPSTPADEDHVFHSYARGRSGLDDALGRPYDPETGRFLQADPIGHDAYRLQDPQSLNLYAFVHNDPVNRRDPLGLCDCDAGGTAVPGLDGGNTCTYPYGKTVYETVVHAESGDGGAILQTWLPNGVHGWGLGPWNGGVEATTAAQSEVDAAIDRQLAKKLREALARAQKCNAANAGFAAAASAYARVSANIASHNLKIEALRWQAAEVAADVAENVTELKEDFSAGQAVAAGTGRVAGIRQVSLQMQAAEIDRALLVADQQAAVNTMRAAAEARDAACR